MSTSYDSKVCDPIWKGYDPDRGEDQPLFASLNPAERKGARAWVHMAWQLNNSGVDVYKLWIARCRKKGISPWISVRMNDVHNVDDERNYIHSDFWRENPQFRRVPYRFTEWTDRALDYGRPEVRAHQMKLIRELIERYDMDGLELDWMRFGFHFRPGHECEGAALLTQFTAEVRHLLDKQERKRGHKIKLSARVPARPETALGLGMDAVTWAKKGLVDMIVVTPFWATIDTDMPIEIWKQLLDGTGVTLAAGFELILRPYPTYPSPATNSLETVRGAAASALDRGADRIYLFNYMDSETCMADIGNYPTLLREVGSLDTLKGKPRRHIVTYTDTWAPGEARSIALPATGRMPAFRVHTGPKPESGKVTVALGIEDEAVTNDTMQVRVNGDLCEFAGKIDLPKPAPPFPVYSYSAPLSAMKRGYNLIEVMATKDVTIKWVEISIRP